MIENTSEEIKDLCIEIDERLKETWLPEEGDEERQDQFWKIFQNDLPIMDPMMDGKGMSLDVNRDIYLPIHGKIKAKIGACYLRNNPKEMM